VLALLSGIKIYRRGRYKFGIAGSSFDIMTSARGRLSNTALLLATFNVKQIGVTGRQIPSETAQPQSGRQNTRDGRIRVAFDDRVETTSGALSGGHQLRAALEFALLAFGDVVKNIMTSGALSDGHQLSAALEFALEFDGVVEHIMTSARGALSGGHQLRAALEFALLAFDDVVEEHIMTSGALSDGHKLSAALEFALEFDDVVEHIMTSACGALSGGQQLRAAVEFALEFEDAVEHIMTSGALSGGYQLRAALEFALEFGDFAEHIIIIVNGRQITASAKEIVRPTSTSGSGCL